MDFAFMRSSTVDYKCPNKATDRIVTSYDGHLSHLIIVDGASRRVWAFLTKSKEPPLDILRAFMTKFRIASGVVCTNQGGELARSAAFRNMMLREFGYVVEPTGADSPSQNGGSEIYNNTLAVKFERSFMDPAFQQNSGRRPSSMQYTSITDSSTWPQTKPPMKVGMVVSRTSPTSRHSALGCASNKRAPEDASWIDTTSLEFSWATLQLIKTSCTWISTQAWLNRATMRYLTKLGTFRLHDHLRPNSSTISAWRRRQNQ
jgi:hypothetical protein